MLVTVAGEKKEIEQGTTIAKLIVDEKVENPDYVTVTVNDDFVSKKMMSSNFFTSWEEEHFNGIYE